MLKKVIFDCDNTMGIDGYPMDDALAFLYVLGNRDKVDLLGFICTFANGTAAQVYEASRQLLQEVGCSALPLLKGAEANEDPRSEAAQFIVDMANRYPGEVSVLAIGSMTNLYGAWLIDPQIFDKLERCVLMGGITEKLYTHGVHCPELNFSINAHASAEVFTHGKNLSIITGNNCLSVSYLPKEEFMEKMEIDKRPVSAYVARKCGYRFDCRREIYGEEGSYCWDAIAAAYLLYPELFEDHLTACDISEEHLQDGSLMPCENGKTILNLPVAKDAAAFRRNLYESWLKLDFVVED
ncbi:MAG: nucleoside hydrolase [Oscillospiraceae bacterium]|nr:nucleoside hydrolase [Oscillospiraceae bacterium]